MSKLPEKIQIRTNAIDRKNLHEFWEEIDKAYQKGYRYKGFMPLKEAPTFAPSPSVTLYHQEYIDSDIEIDKLKCGLPDDWEDRLKTCRKRADIDEFCRKYKVEGVDTTNPNIAKGVVKKLLLDRMITAGDTLTTEQETYRNSPTK